MGRFSMPGEELLKDSVHFVPNPDEAVFQRMAGIWEQWDQMQALTKGVEDERQKVMDKLSELETLLKKHNTWLNWLLSKYKELPEIKQLQTDYDEMKKKMDEVDGEYASKMAFASSFFNTMKSAEQAWRQHFAKN